MNNGGKYMPYVFTENGVAMLSSVAQGRLSVDRQSPLSPFFAISISVISVISVFRQPSWGTYGL